MRHTNKVIAVTGGGSGIGKTIVQRLASEGAHVAVIDHDATRAGEVASEADNAWAITADVTDPDAMVSAMRAIVDHFGGLDGAVNNAGIGGPFASATEYPLEWWDRTIAVNLSGVFYSIRAEIPHFLKGGGGAIVNMSSICGLVGQVGTPAYVVTKHAVIGLTKNIALEYGKQGIRCTAVCPTYVQTPLTLSELNGAAIWAELDERHATGRCASADDVAGLTSFLLSDDARSITGSAHLVDGGITAS